MNEAAFCFLFCFPKLRSALLHQQCTQLGGLFVENEFSTYICSKDNDEYITETDDTLISLSDAYSAAAAAASYKCHVDCLTTPS